MKVARTLAKYTDKRVVAMNSGTSVYDAVRALEANHIGAIVVEDDRRLVGIVTDRDLALRVIGYELDLKDLTLQDVMSRDIAALPMTAEVADAARLMLDRHVRRIPVVEDGRVVGLVTLDDLIADEFDPKRSSQIVRAQLAEPSPLKDKGDLHPTAPVHGQTRPLVSSQERAQRRHRARALLAQHGFAQCVVQCTRLDPTERAEIAAEELLSGLIQRITAEESEHLLAQLPELTRNRLWFVRRGPNRQISRALIEQRLSERLGLQPERATQVIQQLGHALRSYIGPEMEHVYGQLPADLKAIFDR